MSQQKKRLLAAIMFTDMVGYTAMMQQNETLANKKRERHKDILQRSVSEHVGEILQYYGDGTLCIFNSAVEAVKCAVEIQVALLKDPPIPLRIGIHSGDIVYDDEGVYGDAVNVASRIENLAITGSVFISAKVKTELKNHPELTTKLVGQFDLKNVKHPTDVYAVTCGNITIPAVGETRMPLQDKKKSIAVLPFVNMSNDPENEYFSDGISEELLNVLSKVEGLQVTARTSSFAFKGKNEDIREIGKKLGVKSVLEGSVRKAGNRVRVTAQLINTADGYHLWSENYDRELDDIFAIQDEISLKICTRLKENLIHDASSIRFVRPSTKKMEAYNIYLKGLFHIHKWTLRDSELSIKYFNQAIAIDREFVLPYTGLAYCYGYLGGSGKWPPETAFPKAEKYAYKAFELDDKLSETHQALAGVYFWYYWDWKKAFFHINKAVELNPDTADALQFKAMMLMAFGENQEAIETVKKALLLDPLNIISHYCLATICFFNGMNKEAVHQIDTILEMEPYFGDATALKGWIYIQEGVYDKASSLFKHIEKIAGFEEKSITFQGTCYGFQKQPDKANIYLRKLLEIEEKEPQRAIYAFIAFVYLSLDKIEKTFEYLEKAIEKKDASIIYALQHPMYRSYFDDPRFLRLKKIIKLDQSPV